MLLAKICADRLGVSESEVLSIASTAPRRYFVWEVNKKSGGKRILCHPSRELKEVQRVIGREFLSSLPVHSCATAYVKGGSIRENASRHAASRVLAKLDIKEFFPSISASSWAIFAKDNFPEWNQEDVDFSSRVLFWGRGTYLPNCLAIGSPTSPIVSNAMFFEIDEKIFRFCHDKDYVYTRYADDITISGFKHINLNEIALFLQNTFRSAKYSKFILNAQKSLVVSNKYKRSVTGLVLTPDHKISLGRERKRLIDAMMHRYTLSKWANEDKVRLAGLIAFALDVEPQFVASLQKKHSQAMINRLLNRE